MLDFLSLPLAQWQFVDLVLAASTVIVGLFVLTVIIFIASEL